METWTKVILFSEIILITMKKIVVLASGKGTNLQAIIDAVEEGTLNARIEAVISDKKDAYALERAKKHGIEALSIVRTKENREEYFEILLNHLREIDPDVIVLAGFLKILPPFIISEYAGKMINTHPALLPCFGGKGFYGNIVHKAVLDSGARFSGCSVHFVTEDIDGGPIIVQKMCEVKDNDTPDSLSERVLKLEHKALVEAIKIVLEGNYRVEGKRVKMMA